MRRPMARRCGSLRWTMRRFTTSAATDRRRVGALLVAELICALFLVGRPQSAPVRPVVAAPASLTTPTAASTTETLDDGRTVHLVGLGGDHTAPLLTRIAAQMNDAAKAVTAFWGPDWPRDIVIVAAGSDAQFGSLAGRGADIPGTNTGERIKLASGGDVISDTAVRTM